MKGMRFFDFFRVNFGRSTLLPADAVTGRKVLIVVGLWALWIISYIAAFLDSFGLIMVATCGFMLTTTYGTLLTTRPSQYFLYPISPKRKILYEYAGMFLLTAACSLLALVFIGVLTLFNSALGAWFADKPLAEVISSSSFLSPWAPFLHGDVYGGLAVVGIFLLGIGAGELYNVLAKRGRKIFLSAFIAINTAVNIAVLLACMQVAPANGLEDSFGAFFALRYMPLNWLYLVALFLSALSFFAASFLLRLRSLRR